MFIIVQQESRWITKLREAGSPHQFGAGCSRKVSEGRWAVGLCGGGLRGPQLAGSCLVLDGSLRERAVGEWLPANLPQLRTGRHIPFVQHGAGVVPDLVAVTDPKSRRTGGRDHMLPIRAPGEMCGVWSLRLRHLRQQRGKAHCGITTTVELK